MNLYLIAVIIWAASVIATPGFESHGNWSNDKELPTYGYIYEIKEGVRSSQTRDSSRPSEVEDDTYAGTEDRYSTSVKDPDERTYHSPTSSESYEEENKETVVEFIAENGDDYKNETNVDSQHRFPMQVIQPYVVDTGTEPTQKEIQNKSFDVSELNRPTRMNQKTSNHTVTIDYSPSQEIIFDDPNISAQENNTNELGYIVNEEYEDVLNIGGFGQRVRTPLLLNKDPESSDRIKTIPLDGAVVSRDRKLYRGQESRPFSRGLFSSRRQNVSENINGSTRLLSLDDLYRISSVPAKNTESRNLKQEENAEGHLNVDNLPRANDESYQPKKVKGTSFSNTTPSQVLGKFSGPIVVSELPRYKKIPYTISTDYPENSVSSTPKPIAFPTESVALPEVIKSKSLESNYLAPSSVVLNPLQVGVALVNAAQVLNTADDQTLTKVVSENENIDQNEASKSQFQEDQLLQQEQTSEVVAQNSPTHSVEIQKSVEIFHTAPIQEIHYPPEYIPHLQQSSGKHRLVESNESKIPQKSDPGPVKDRRPPQVNFNIYKSNEIAEENIVQTRNRYEYENEVNKIVPLPSTIIYSSNGGQEQLDDALYDQSNLHHSAKLKGIAGEQDITKELNKQYSFDFGKTSSANFVRQEPQNPPNVGNLETQNQEAPQFIFTKIPQTEPSPQDRKILLPIPQPYPVEKVVEKTVHVPHPIELDKVIEKKVPYPVEKIIEKQVTIPQPFPVHIPVDRVVEKQIRIPQLYPIHIERVIEKKVPYAIQRFILQPYPVHIKVPQAYHIEKQVHIPVPIEKVVEKTVHMPRPYPIEVEKTVDRRHPIEILKFVKSVPSHQFHNLQHDVTYQHAIRPQNYHQTTSNPSYGSISDDQNHSNSSQYYGHPYSGYVSSNRLGPVRQPLPHAFSKKIGSYGPLYSQSAVSYSKRNVGNHQNSMNYGRHTIGEKEKIKDEYVGPVPRKVQGSIGIQSKSSQFPSSDVQSLATLTPLRTVRQDGNTGSFRQSKMEYGFKPPMVPSVQYDEKTASKVE